jgi:hypothetical protein
VALLQMPVLLHSMALWDPTEAKSSVLVQSAGALGQAREEQSGKKSSLTALSLSLADPKPSKHLHRSEQKSHTPLPLQYDLDLQLSPIGWVYSTEDKLRKYRLLETATRNSFMLAGWPQRDESLLGYASMMTEKGVPAGNTWLG